MELLTVPPATEDSDGDAGLKDRVREYWNAKPCGTQFTRLPWGSPAFFLDVERTRYASHPFLPAIAEFNAFRGKKLLEVGSGLGTDLINFARRGAEVSAVDLTSSGIDLVRRRFEAEGLAVDARVGDAEHLPFADEAFDAVYSFGVLHHTPAIEQAVKEVYRVLRPGGRIIIMLYHMHSLRVALGAPLYGLKQMARGQWRWGSTIKDWNRIYDGVQNPLGRAYTRSDADRLFGQFRNRRYTVRHPVRLSLPPILQTLTQKIAPLCGFFLVLKAEK